MGVTFKLWGEEAEETGSLQQPLKNHLEGRARRTDVTHHKAPARVDHPCFPPFDVYAPLQTMVAERMLASLLEAVLYFEKKL